MRNVRVFALPASKTCRHCRRASNASATDLQHQEPEAQRLAVVIIDSFRRVVGQELLPGLNATAAKENCEDRRRIEKVCSQKLFDAPFPVLAHGGGPDPKFTYGNRAALLLFGHSWGSLRQTSSRMSAEPDLREERSKAMAQVTRDGYLRNYSGIRISSSGQRFRIRDTIIWNLIDEAGQYHGQAATFSDWSYLSE
eukprot:TRINITY_DN52197_c0_g1_i1.p1 TRINITY_DN52197_c0_g1~~TRINITY_DN52197_c0_g1_i1.p1  ORF type:complete len:196 (+),score=28.98 TRINITY_DN52197_c0_g1_i1:100-687(+)